MDLSDIDDVEELEDESEYEHDDEENYYSNIFNNVVDDYNEDMEMFRVCEGMLHYYIKYVHKEPSTTSSKTGLDWVNEKLKGNPRVCQENLRMLPHVFENLCSILESRYGLNPTNQTTIKERVAIFVYIIGQGATNRQARDIFHRSGWSIGKHFYDVLNAVVRMSVDFIKPKENSNVQVPSHIAKNSKYQFFENCIGAIDGTHVRAVPPKEYISAYIGRKGYATQNILAICDFDMCFTFVWAGWEGIAHDSRIFELARVRKELKFPHPPNGKYYLVDAGYPNTKGYLAPFKNKNVRYHLPDFRRGSRSSQHPRNRYERFNKAHSSLRSVIERSFGVWKARFKILKVMPAFPFKTQILIIIASMAIHNFIRREARIDDDMFFGDENCNDYPDNDIDNETSGNPNSGEGYADSQSTDRREDNIFMENFRQSLLQSICNSSYWT